MPSSPSNLSRNCTKAPAAHAQACCPVPKFSVRSCPWPRGPDRSKRSEKPRIFATPRPAPSAEARPEGRAARRRTAKRRRTKKRRPAPSRASDRAETRPRQHPSARGRGRGRTASSRGRPRARASRTPRPPSSPNEGHRRVRTQRLARDGDVVGQRVADLLQFQTIQIRATRLVDGAVQRRVSRLVEYVQDAASVDAVVSLPAMTKSKRCRGCRRRPACRPSELGEAVRRLRRRRRAVALRHAAPCQPPVRGSSSSVTRTFLAQRRVVAGQLWHLVPPSRRWPPDRTRLHRSAPRRRRLARGRT